MPKLSFASVQNERLHHYVGRQIARSIIRGELQVGECIPAEASLIDSFNVSRAVIREALRSLEQRGMIETSQGRLSLVRDEKHWDILDPTILEVFREEGKIHPLLCDFLWIRLRLEPEIAAEAARRNNPTFLSDLKNILVRMETLVDIPAEFFDEDMAFHNRLASEVGNRVLLHLMKTISQLFNVSRDLARDSNEGPSGALIYHQRIYTCIVESDAEGARQSMREHLEWTAKRIEQSFV